MASKLFAERGFDAVTVNEIADAAEIAKATLFTYFPTKESLALEGVGDEDLAGVVAGRPSGRSALDALLTHYRAFAAAPVAPRDRDELVTRMRVIFDSPALSGAANRLLYGQRQALAQVLAEEHGETAAALMAAQITSSLLAVQEFFFHRLVCGASLEEASGALAANVELAFELLKHGLAQEPHH